MNRFEVQRFAMQFRRRDLTVALIFPREDRGELIVVAQRFAFGRLMFCAKMCATRFVASEGVNAHQLAELEKIGDAPGALKRLIEVFAIAWNAHLTPEFLSQL